MNMNGEKVTYYLIYVIGCYHNDDVYDWFTPAWCCHLWWPGLGTQVLARGDTSIFLCSGQCPLPTSGQGDLVTQTIVIVAFDTHGDI